MAEARLDDALTSVGLTFVKWRAIDSLMMAGEPIPLKRLPEQLGCVKSNITQLVDKLEAEGILRRLPDPEDRRGTRVELTEKGRAAYTTGREALESATHALFANFSHEDSEALRRLLGLLKRSDHE